MLGIVKKVGLGIGITFLAIVVGTGLFFHLQYEYSHRNLSDSSQFDPETTQEALEILTDTNESYRELTALCQEVNSYSDYEALKALGALEPDGSFFLVNDIDETNEIISYLEELGYADHPTVGSVMYEYLQVLSDFSNCLEDKIRIYG